MRRPFALLAAALLGLVAVGTGCSATRATTEKEWTPDRFKVAEGSNRTFVIAQEVQPGGVKRVKHRVNGLVGGTTDRGGGGFTIGGNYEYLLKHELGIAGFADITFGSRTTTTVGGGVWWHPADRWNLLAAPGVSFGNGTDVFVRLGVAYDFPFKEYLLSPYVSVDVFGNKTPVFFAFSFGKKF